VGTSPSDSVVAPPERAPLPPVPAFRRGEPSSAGLPVLTPDGPPRRRRRRRRVAAALALVLVASGTAVAVAQLHAPTPARPAPVQAAPVGRTQTTVLFALTSAAGAPGGDGASESALLAADPAAGTGSVALLPARVVASVPGRGQLPLGRAVSVRDQAAGIATVADLLGVTVDGGWRLTPEALAALVDRLGGVQLDVNADVVLGGALVLRAGVGQRLDGTAAVRYAQYAAPDEDETARLARLQAVLAAVIAALPADRARLAAALVALGGGSESTLRPDRLATVLHTLAAAAGGAAGPVFAILPVVSLDTGSGTSAYRVDGPGLSSYVASNLAASRAPGSGRDGVRVFVYNGTFAYGVGSAARDKLVAAGMSFVGSRNEATPGRATSVVLVPDGSPASRAAGERVAKALGLPGSSVRVADGPQDVADVVVLAGSDLR